MNCRLVSLTPSRPVLSSPSVCVLVSRRGVACSPLLCTRATVLQIISQSVSDLTRLDLMEEEEEDKEKEKVRRVVQAKEEEE